ncbi:MAG: Gfo/Idh/MocA family protein [Janthinobacterium lividum]
MIRLALVGLGKIARDQHLPSIARTPGIELAAIASRNATLDGVPCFPDLATLLASGPPVDAVALCTPPQGRHALAAAALAAGCHVLLEKPPGASVAEIAPLAAAASASGRTLFATWHSRFAPGVEPARAILAGRRILAARIAWKEDVRVWHPGQQWIWEPGGLGVFDPGINALSILTAILPRPVFLTAAALSFPANRAAPIAADLSFADPDGAQIEAAFDWRQTGPQSWDIAVDAEGASVALSEGGRVLARDGRPHTDAPSAEYDAIYRRFVALAQSGASDVDLAPLVHVADAFMLGRRIVVEDFADR